MVEAGRAIPENVGEGTIEVSVGEMQKVKRRKDFLINCKRKELNLCGAMQFMYRNKR